MSRRRRPRWCAVLVSLGVWASACGGRTSPSAPSDSTAPLQPGTTINYTAIAASDGIGFGSSVVCLPLLDCPNGNGYVQVAARQLRATGYTVNLANPSIPAAVIGPDFQRLGIQYGRTIPANFIEQEAPATPKNTTLVTIFAGANDVNAVTAALGGGAGGADPAGYIDGQVRAFGADVDQLLGIVRGIAGSPRIIVLNLPNMGALPFLAGASVSQRQAAQRLSVGITASVINPLTAQGVIVVDLMCDERAYAASTYSSDGFHPNDAGYAWMAAEVVAAATTNYRSPRASCAQMSLVPQ